MASNLTTNKNTAFQLEYAKTDYFEALRLIYTNDSIDRGNIKNWIKLGIGAYSETKKHHRLGAKYISQAAHSLLLKNKQRSESALHGFISKSINGLTHEHMTPKIALMSVLDGFGKEDWGDEGVAKKTLEKCSACAIILRRENEEINKPYSKTHPQITNGRLSCNIANFDIQARYRGKVDLLDFVISNYISRLG